MAAIARRAGVSKQTLYRWWSSPAAILLEALNAGAVRIAPLEESGELAADLPRFVRRSVLGARGETGALLRTLMAEAQRDPLFAATFRDGFLAQRRAVLRTLLEHAAERGEIAPDVDLDLAVELFYGTLWYRLLAASGPLDRRFADALAELLLAQLRAPAR